MTLFLFTKLLLVRQSQPHDNFCTSCDCRKDKDHSYQFLLQREWAVVLVFVGRFVPPPHVRRDFRLTFRFFVLVVLSRKTKRHTDCH
jgi:hypothetical protein